MTAQKSRPRLLEATWTTPLTALVGHAGAGKTVTLDATVAAHAGPSIRVDVAELGAEPLPADVERTLERTSMGSAQTLLVVLDDLERADAHAATVLVDLIERWSAPHRLVLAGRRLPGTVTAALERHDARFIDARELQFDDSELLEVLGATVTRRLNVGDPQLLADRCARWPGSDRSCRRPPAVVRRQ